jgi:5-methylcytosine-specific restriction endonuclease McrA
MCAYCGRELMAELDHGVPLSKGGSTDPEVNGVPACLKCHDIKTRKEGQEAIRESRLRHFRSGTAPHSSAREAMPNTSRGKHR